jgi:hypothetical protein
LPLVRCPRVVRFCGLPAAAAAVSADWVAWYCVWFPSVLCRGPDQIKDMAESKRVNNAARSREAATVEAALAAPHVHTVVVSGHFWPSLSVRGHGTRGEGWCARGWHMGCPRLGCWSVVFPMCL